MISDPKMAELGLAVFDRARHEAAMQAMFTRLEAQARRTAAHVVKARARAYRDRPISLESIASGMSLLSGKSLVAIGEHLLEFERKRGARFGSAKAIILLGRYWRRIEQRRKEAA